MKIEFFILQVFFYFILATYASNFCSTSECSEKNSQLIVIPRWSESHETPVWYAVFLVWFRLPLFFMINKSNSSHYEYHSSTEWTARTATIITLRITSREKLKRNELVLSLNDCEVAVSSRKNPYWVSCGMQPNKTSWW